MVKEKVVKVGDTIEVIYTKDHWRLLQKKREKAASIMEALRIRGLEPIVHGSIARGDVHARSDVDIVLTIPQSPYIVELALELSGIEVHHKAIVQATPSNTPKVYLYLTGDETECVSYPLNKLKPRELEFYKFGGMLDYEMLIKNVRVPGVNKKLLLIVPTEKGHIEKPIIGKEHEVAKLLNISIDTVMERVRVLTRRDELGRTGVFIKKVLPSDASIEEAVNRIKRENPLFRRALEA